MWEYASPVKLCFGENSVYKLADILEKNDYRRVVLFTRKIEKLPRSAQEAIEKAGSRIVKVFDSIKPEPETEDITAYACQLQGESFDAFAAIGGGSVIDTAKATMAVYANKCSIDDFMKKEAVFSSRLPIIAVPTTSGTGSEVTRAAALTWNGKKQPIFDDTLYPTVSIIDPALTLSCPPAVTASCGLDVLSHAVESLMHKAANPMSRSYAMDAIALCNVSLEECFKNGDNIKARTNMSLASMKAGLAIAACGCSASHACSYMLSTEFKMSHGAACAFTLDKLVLICSQHDGRFKRVSAALGFKGEREFAGWIAELKRTLRQPLSLEEAGIDEENKQKLVDAAWASPVLKNHYFELTKEEISSLF